MLTDSEKRCLVEIEEWERSHLASSVTDFQEAYEALMNTSFSKLGERRQAQLLLWSDQILFYLHSLIHNSRYSEEARTRLIEQGQIFDEEIDSIERMKRLSIVQLNYIAKQQLAKQRLLSLAQGGLAGFGGIVLLGLDLPAMFVLNLQAIQLTALTYGFEIKHPSEMMFALKLFHLALLPKNLQKVAWDELWDEVVKHDRESLFYEGKEEVTSILSFHQPLKQVGKAVMIMLLRKKLIQGIPVVGIVVGATINYRFSYELTEIAHKFYQKRYLYEKYSN
ncbi:MAG TPA: EcsC family protein [Bacilli bacterium]|nr:EcsC family protein [Bacilli bacterium]